MAMARPIETDTFYTTVGAPVVHKPLFLGCSGGGGHNAAIDAIRRYLLKEGRVNELSLPFFAPILAQNRPSGSAAMVRFGAVASNLPLINAGTKLILDALATPNIPSLGDIEEEVGNLSKDQEKKGLRPYVDVLLDAYPAGYYFAAIWNILQRRDQTDELNKLINFQKDSDQQNYAAAKEYFLQKLDDAYLQRSPYTEVISTQAMALPALCDAVKEYNKKRGAQLKIHQYMSDLPTIGAVHFFNSLSRLSEEQCQLMCLYGVNLQQNAEALHQKFKFFNQNFFKLINLDPKANPMVRPGFSDKKLEDISFVKDLELKVMEAKNEKAILIKANEKVAAIMLGSQAGIDTIDYVMELAQEKGLYDHIFVFGGSSAHIKDKLEEKMKRLRELNPQLAQIILLDPQDDAHMAPIMTRSDLLVIRGGGLTVMEQLAMPHANPEQVILFHSKRNNKNQFSSGISWEDENVNQAKVYLMAKHQLKKIERTQTSEVIVELTQRKQAVGAEDKAQIGKDVFSALLWQINKLRHKNGAKEFVVALDALHMNLNTDYRKQLEKGWSAKSLVKGPAIQIALKTTAMLENLQRLVEDPQTQNQQAVIDLMRRYEKECTRNSGYEIFAKILLIVIAAAIGFALGAFIGAGIGVFVGAWATSGALLAACSAGTAGGIGLAAGASATGLAAASLGGHLLFKPTKRHIDVNHAVNAGVTLDPVQLAAPAA